MTTNDERPNVVWLTLDSIRADHTTMNGYERNTTPNMQRLADDPSGEAFTNCITVDNWSLPSVASMLTGTYPIYHRVGHDTQVLPNRVETIAEKLAANGWQTSAVSVNKYFSEPTNLNRGFEWFQSIDATNFVRAAGTLPTLKYALRLNRHSAGFTFDKRKHRPDYLVNELAKKRLKSLHGDEKPFFLMAHYHGAHHPYYPPNSIFERFADDLDVTPQEAREIAFSKTTDIFQSIAESHTYSEREWQSIEAMYDALIAYTDELVGDIAAHIKSLGIADNTILVVTADHGDLLGERGLLSHKLVLHDALVHVPMVVVGMEDLAGLSSRLVQPIDIMQTILSTAGVSSEQFQGIDIRNEKRDFAVSQRGATGEEGIEAIHSHNPSFDDSGFHESAMTALRTTDFKFQESEEGAELFELPDETSDVREEHPEKAAEFQAKLTKWRNECSARSVKGSDAEFSDSVKEQLSDLGYLID